MTLWSILAAPLLAGNDLREMTPATKAILLNRDVIAVDQDKAGHQGHRISKTDTKEVWVRDLEGNAKAVALFNRGGDAARMSLKWSDIGLKGRLHARDLWTHSDVKVDGDEFAASVPSHGVVMLRVNQ
jgi:alpha-galactosidase